LHVAHYLVDGGGGAAGRMYKTVTKKEVFDGRRFSGTLLLPASESRVGGGSYLDHIKD
jgi:hypothetical protein